MSDRGSAPSVDLVLAVRNEEKMLGPCLESILDQDYDAGRTRIIVVDNGSTDSTRDVCARYPVTLEIEKRPGPAAARNRGISAGIGELVAFLDGHCIANRSWISAMVSRFQDLRVGGCQARIENRASDPRVAQFLHDTGADDPDKVLDDTVRGERNIYPWILSGNCMFRRQALEHTGGFDDMLPACEDVDISWKAVLSGYLLACSPEASVIHWNGDAWDAFVRKSFTQGSGAAVLAHRYLPLGAQNVFQPVAVSDLGPDRAEVAFAYQAGYEDEEQRIASGETRNVRIDLPRVRKELRVPFRWTDEVFLSISADALYWLRDDAQSIIIHHPSESRIILDGSADFIWRRLSRGAGREELSEEIARRFRIKPEAAADDCEDLVGELIDSGVLMRHER